MSEILSGCWRRIGVFGGDHSCEVLASVLHCRNCEVLRGAARQLFERNAAPDDEAAPPGLEARALPTRTALSVRLGSRWLGLPTSHVVEVTAERPVRRVAHRCRGQVEGVVNIRGELHLCVALADLLQLSLSEGSGRMVLVGQRGGAPLAFRCNQVGELLGYQPSELEAHPDTLSPALQACVIGMLAREDNRIAVLDGDALLQQLEQGLYS